jgi:TPR repeat protein
MATLNKKEAILKQIGILISSREYEKAYGLSKEFAAGHNDALSYLILAKCLFWLNSYNEMLPQARKAFRMASGQEKESAAVLLAAACYRLGRMAEGRKALVSLGNTRNMDVIKMRFMIAAMQGRRKEQDLLLKELSAINKKETGKFVMSILLKRDFERIDAIGAVPKKVSPSKLQ